MEERDNNEIREEEIRADDADPTLENDRSMKKPHQNLTEHFTERMSGGAFAYRAAEGHELLFANQNMVRLFECEDYEEFAEYVGNSFEGVIVEEQRDAVLRNIDLTVSGTLNRSGHIIFKILTKKGNERLVEDHWMLVSDPEEGDIFYVFVVSREFDTQGSGIDPVTGLYGNVEFHNYVAEMIRKTERRKLQDYAIAYINLVNFKLLNINKGVGEGDRCLKTVAECLSRHVGDSFVARLGDDHFVVFARYDRLQQRVKKAEDEFLENYGIEYNVTGKVGIYRFEDKKEMNVESAISIAKVACDYIKYESKTNMVEYSEKLAEEITTTEYVIRKVDEAIANDWIKLYFQPVIRSLTGQLCGMESLVRWDDPEIGFLLPGRFIEILEKEREITKLDCYVVDKVCRCIQERMVSGKPIVPVSVNFSRLDFIMCDMLQVVEEAVAKYEIPKDYIHFEITESMIASDEELMRDVIERFRGAGYEIWMDDFGSGYSSLTLLKDYDFDMLKLDMRFLSSFTEKSKDIMKAAVSMAKAIGTRTLAEGVETKEQLDFLKGIGCGRIQGYYYGRPEPIDDMFRHLAEKNVPVEPGRWRKFYDVASNSVRSTETPLEIIVDDGRNFKTLFMNESYREQIFGNREELPLEEIDKRVYNTRSPLPKKYREIADALRKSGKAENFYYSGNGDYFCFHGQVLARENGHTLIKGSIYNISQDPNHTDMERLDAKLRGLHLLYEEVFLIDLKENVVTSILGENRHLTIPMDDEQRKRKAMKIIRELIAPEDADRYEQFLDLGTLRERVEAEQVGYISGVFRQKQGEEGYVLKEIAIMMIPGTDGTEYLYAVKPYIM